MVGVFGLWLVVSWSVGRWSVVGGRLVGGFKETPEPSGQDQQNGKQTYCPLLP